jgi:hypothetical protein
MSLYGSTLYGFDYQAGPSGQGAIFKINTDGSGYGHVYSFTDGFSAAQGSDLALFGSTLYGTHEGSSPYVYQINTDGTAFAPLHSFLGGTNDGSAPMDYGGPILSGAVLYGTTQKGGTNNYDIVYALTVPEPSTLTLVACGLAVCAVAVIRRRSAAKGGFEHVAVTTTSATPFL